MYHPYFFVSYSDRQDGEVPRRYPSLRKSFGEVQRTEVKGGEIFRTKLDRQEIVRKDVLLDIKTLRFIPLRNFLVPFDIVKLVVFLT